MRTSFDLRIIPCNGINLRAAVAGNGPLIVLVHGWPETWYCWRHQIKPLADAGYRVVAVDMRGYGGSDKPHAVQAYDMVEMMADVVGLIDHFGEDKAILVGHDWGAPICWNTAALQPERVAAVAGLSVPYSKRGPVSLMTLWKSLYAKKFFYQLYFQKEGIAEAELEHDVAATLRKIYYSISGDVGAPSPWANIPVSGGMLDSLPDPHPFPDWLKGADLEYLTEQFEASGFRGPLNRYRNQDRDFDNLPHMGATPIHQPSCFIGGAKDPVRYFVPGHDSYANPAVNATDLRFSRIIPGMGHWIQQEAPDQVTQALVEFLNGL